MKRKLARYGVELIDSYGIIQPAQNTLAHLGFEYEWSRFAPSEIAELVMANYGKAEVTTILTRMIGEQIQLVQSGYHVGPPDDGYVTARVSVNGKKKTVLAPDPERAKFYVAMFTLRAGGALTDEQIVARINAMGYRSKLRNVWSPGKDALVGQTGGLPLTVKQLQRVIRRPIYCGVICEKWTRHQPVRARYAGLVSIDLFNRANRGKVQLRDADGALRILYDHDPQRIVKRRQRANPLFPFKNVVLCPLCRHPFFASCPRGKSGKTFPTYHCSRRHPYYGVPKAVLEAALSDFGKRCSAHTSAGFR